MRWPLLTGVFLLTLPYHAFAPCHAFAQGAVIESLEELRRGSTQPQPPDFSARTLETPAPLPERFDLSEKLPAVRNQGRTDTCVSWAATYVAASVALRGRVNAVTLSPSFTYNQVARDQWCRKGTNASATLNFLRDVGTLPLDEFAFDGGWCGRQPTAAELERAKQYRIKGWSAFDATVIDRVKQELVHGVPVIFSVRTTPKMHALRGDAVLEEDETPGEGHSMVVVGYDDAKHAFRIQNSWGPAWGDKGYGWFGYEFWKRNIRAGFVIQ
jgi:C1A family cysteine protease